MVKATAISAFIGIALLSAAARADSFPPVPGAIRPDSGHSPYLTAHAQGYQIYQCVLNNGAYDWTLQGPKAHLADDKGHDLGLHDYGPVWQDRQGGRITGKAIRKLDRDIQSALPWLLVQITARWGKGDFTRASFVNRINTFGGLPPSLTCNGNRLGSEKKVPYRADYVFYD